MSVYSIINEEHLTPDLAMLENVCGIDAVRALLANFGGMTFYIPKLSRLEQFVLEYINDNLQCKSYKQIAKDLSVSETFIRTLEKKSLRKNYFK